MIDALTATQTGMLNDVQRMHAISQNLANVSTPGYKKERVVAHGFPELLGIPGVNGTEGYAEVPIPQLQTYTDFSAGTLHYTGNPLDLAVQGNEFFAVSTPNGVAYTRQGNFHLDSSGRLVTASGLPVLGESGDIRLTNPTPKIDQQGQIRDGNNAVQHLSVVNVTNPETLEDKGDGLFVSTPSTVFGASGQVDVRQGYNETSNVVSMNQMIKLIDTVRHFESSERVLRSYDNMLKRAINILPTF